MNNRALELFFSQNSIRGFRPIAVPPGIREQLLEAAVKAPLVSGLQAYSMVIVDDPQQRRRMYEACGRDPLLSEAPLVVVFCVDTYRLKHLMEHFSCDYYLGNPLVFLLAICDAMAAAQNMTVAANSKGLGATYSGAVLNEPHSIQHILQLPEYVFPVTMLLLGYTVSDSPQQHRFKRLVHMNRYQKPDKSQLAELKEYYQQLCKDDLRVFHKYKDITEVKAKTIWNGLLQSGFFRSNDKKSREQHPAEAKLELEKTLPVIRQAQKLTRKRKQHLFSRVNLLYNLAQYYLFRKQPQRAINYFSEAVLLVPDAVELYCCLGILHQHLGNKHRSLAYFEKAVRLDTGEPYFQLWLGKAQAFWGEVNTARNSLDKALQLNPGLVDAWVEKAKLLERLNEWEGALACYKRAESLQKPDHILFNNMAVVYLQLGFFSEAMSYCQKALKLRPRDPILLANKGLALSKLGKFKEAAECYTQALKSQSDNIDFLNNKGYCLMEMKQYQEALAIYELTLELKPGTLSVLENKASCLTLLGRMDEALACYDEILQQTPREPTVLNNKALCLTKLGRYRPALLCHKQALEEEPNNTVFLSNTASCLMKIERYEEALLYYDLALQLQPGEPSLLSGKGICLDYLGRMDEALDCYNHALRLA